MLQTTRRNYPVAMQRPSWKNRGKNFSDLGVLLSIVGATGSTIVSYILPGAIYHSMHTGDRGWKRQAAGAMFLAGCGIIPMALSFIIFGGASH